MDNKANLSKKKSNVNSSSEEDTPNQNQPYQEQDHSNKNLGNNTNTNNTNFIRRLFACGGYCARSNRRNSQNVSGSSSAYGLSRSTTNIQNNRTPQTQTSFLKNNNNQKETKLNFKKNLADNNSNLNLNKNSIKNKNNSQSHSELSLNDISPNLMNSEPENNYNPNSKHQSFESIIDKILSTPTKLKSVNKNNNNNSQTSYTFKNAKQDTNVSKSPGKAKHRKNLLNENLKKIESDNHKLFKKTEICIYKNNKNSNLVLPVLKINDINLASQQNKEKNNKNDQTKENYSLIGKEQISADSTRTNANTEDDSDEYDEEEEDDETDEDEEIEDIDALEQEMLKALRNEDGYDLYNDLEECEENEEGEENYDLYCGYEVENVEEEYDENETENTDLKIKNMKSKIRLKGATNELNNNTNKKVESSDKVTFSRKSEVCVTRIKSDKDKSDDELVDSNKYFNSLQHFQLSNNNNYNNNFNATSNESNDNKNTQSSFKKSGLAFSGNSHFYSESLNSANNGANLFVLLAANRKKNSLNNENKSLLIQHSSTEKLETKSPVKNYSETNFLSPSNNIVPSTSLNSNLISASNLISEQGSFIRQTSHEPISKKNVHVAMKPVSSVSVSTTNTSDSNITTSHSLNIPQNLLESMSQVSSNYSIDKSSSTLPTRGGEVSIQGNTKNSSILQKNSTDIDLEEYEESDVLNEIFKVNQWLTDNHRNKNTTAIVTHLLEQNKEENIHSQNNQNSIESILSNTLSDINNNEDEDDYDYEQGGVNSNDNTCNKGSGSGENNDSAIDISSYGSISNLSKVSSKTNRVKWQSFTKYYRLNLQNNALWSKNQISYISCEQLMALRKLALLQFSKLLERQHSSMIRTLRLFSKKRDLAEFQRVYDSIDSLSKSESSKLKTNTSNFNNMDNLNNGNGMNLENVIIDTKKISHQLGAQIGSHPTNEITSTRKRRKNKLKKLEQQLINEKLNILPKSNSNIFQENDSYSGETKSQLNSGGGPEYRNVNDNLKYTIFNNSNKTSRVVFGVPLSKIIQQTGQALPQRILEAMKFIRKIAQHEVGIFRKNGVKTRITKLKELIDKNEIINFQSSDFTVFDIADMIKLYFRELPECLLTNKLSDILLTNYNKILPEERKIILQQVMLLIPDENRLVLQTLLLFLNEIAKYNKINQMTRSNLAVCFSPVIFRFSLEKKANVTLKTPLKLESSTGNYSKITSTATTTTTTISSSNTDKNSSNSNVSAFLTSLPLEISLPIQKSKNILKDDNSTNDNKTNSNSTNDNNTANNTRNEETVTPTSSNSTTRPRIPSEGESSLLEKESSIDIEFSSVTLTEDNTSYRKQQMSNIAEMNSSTSSTTAHSVFFQPISQPLIISHAQQTSNSSSSHNKQNYKRKYSEKINRAASSLVNFGAELSSSKPTAFFSDSFKENLETMSKVIQLCVADMIKYSMDLFTITTESFDKLNLPINEQQSTEPPNLSYFYNLTTKKIQNEDFFTTKFNIDKTFWTYQDKFEDVSIYFCKTDQSNQQNQGLDNSCNNSPLQTNNSQIPVKSADANMLANVPLSAGCFSLTSVLVPKPNAFFNKLKLWKCCTLVKTPNLTCQKILNRIKNERHMWDDDFRDGKVTEVLDENTDLFKYTISFMPPHPSREFFEIRHLSMQKSDNDTAIFTTSSVNQPKLIRKESTDVSASLLVSKYVIEKLIANDTTTTFKITHYVKLDYRGFTLEFYNKTFGYIMARLLYNLKVSLTNDNKG